MKWLVLTQEGKSTVICNGDVVLASVTPQQAELELYLRLWPDEDDVVFLREDDNCVLITAANYLKNVSEETKAEYQSMKEQYDGE